MEDFASELRASFGARLHFYPEIDSTQQAALAAARAGEAEGALFVAERQTAGRGRHGHSWVSPSGAGVYATLLLRPRRAAAHLPLLTLAAGLALADAVATTCGLDAEIRWPNDLLLGGKKFCGLMIESTAEAAALGFGINVRAVPMPPEVAALATALDPHLPQPVNRARLCAAAVAALERRYAAWSAGDDAALRDEFEARSRYARGLHVVVEGNWTGVTAGLDESGFLLVRTPAGQLRTVVAGDVRPAAAN